jgi:hypothetical protein
VPRASAAEAQREPARQRFDPVTTVALFVLWIMRPLHFLKAIFPSEISFEFRAGKP